MPSYPRNTVELQISFSKFPHSARLSAANVEFHVSRKARDRYAFDLSMFSSSGSVIFANFYAARIFSQKINQLRQAEGQSQLISAAHLNAVGLIDEILHTILQRYREEIKPQIFRESLEYLQEKFGDDELDRCLLQFVTDFPPLAVYIGEINEKTYLQGSTNGIPHKETALEEMLLLWLSNLNPAFADFRELFEDDQLRATTAYPKIMTELEAFFEKQPHFGPGQGGQSLYRLLRQPAVDAPFSLADQLRFLRMNWGTLIEGDFTLDWDSLLPSDFVEHWGQPASDYETRLLRNIDFMQEEQKERYNPASGAAQTHVPHYDDAYDEPEAFSADLHWMPRLVLIAKSTLVWLDQLSQQYKKGIKRLDQIPDETLDQLASWGITGLWLIGLWERSQASRRIKHLCGNPDAEASAYALYDYQIAHELGGQEAYNDLKERCWKRGIRMGSDMVPNHTGVDSRLVHEHPEWFVQNPHPPFPVYRFEGHNLSTNPEVGIYLEDHYYDRTDAAVVFKHVDFSSGKSRYIYHGNDGTSMPWNDTAQLNYLLPQVREAIIQKILEVARLSPIIRFDAAMTLAKKHYQRLWFPQPGSGGDIPSRAEHGLTRDQFDKLMPIEFWREVVDRVAQEAPDTLLLAEAFWLMEGYFVRTLGMHRVYNSAFMHMLKNEENKKYRYTIKNTLEFEPEVLKRYVNFMNNPDEDTAVAQFGDGDKYFGVCVMMATMPGLPMFGHGQIEGFREKYGMEFRRAYMNETPNEYLVHRHEKEVFPLLKRRYLFAEVENFLLYDFYLSSGTVNENVFAYSNRFNKERCLIVFNNAYQQTQGWIRTSAAFSQKIGSDGEKALAQQSLGEGLDLPTKTTTFCIARDQISGLEYIYRCASLWENGMYVEIGGYKYQVLLDFRIVEDNAETSYERLSGFLGGRGVPSIEEALHELHLQPLHLAFRQYFTADQLEAVNLLRQKKQAKITAKMLTSNIRHGFTRFVTAASEYSVPTADNPASFSTTAAKSITALTEFSVREIRDQLPEKLSAVQKRLFKRLTSLEANLPLQTAVISSWVFIRAIDLLWQDAGSKASKSEEPSVSRSWLLPKVVRSELQSSGMEAGEAQVAVEIATLYLSNTNWLPEKGTVATAAAKALQNAAADPAFAEFLQVNEFEGVRWFNKERFYTANDWLLLQEVFEQFADHQKSAKTKVTAADRKKFADRLTRLMQIFEHWEKICAKSEYRYDKLIGRKRKESKSRQKTKEPSLQKSRVKKEAKTGKKSSPTREKETTKGRQTEKTSKSKKS